MFKAQYVTFPKKQCIDLNIIPLSYPITQECVAVSASAQTRPPPCISLLSQYLTVLGTLYQPKMSVSDVLGRRDSAVICISWAFTNSSDKSHSFYL